MILIFLTITVCLIVYLKFIKPWMFWKNEKIPYIKALPFIGNMLPFVSGKITFYNLLEVLYKSRNQRYFGIMMFSKPIILLKDLEVIKQIMIKDFDHFTDHQNPFNETNEPVFRDNLVSIKGQHWRNLRVTLSPVFTGSKMRAMFNLIDDCTKRFTNHFLKTATNDQPIEVELKEIYKRLTIDIIATCAFGIESNSVEDKDNTFYQRAEEASSFTGSRGFKLTGFLIIPKLMRLLKMRLYSEEQVQFFRNIVVTAIEYREKNNIVRPDLIHLMMQAQKGQLKHEETSKLDESGFAILEETDVGKTNGSRLDITDDLITAQAMVFFVAGVDTTSSTLCFTTYELAINPDIQKKLQIEIDSVYKECKGQMTYEAISKMKYLDMVVSESLRKWPQAYVLDRVCVKDYVIKPAQPDEFAYTVKKGQNVWIPAIAIHRDPKYYHDPEKFDPERFNEENKKKIDPYAFIPFGQGPRICIGNRFALSVIKTTIFNILHKFDLVVIKKTEIPLQLKKSQLFIQAANGFWIGFQKRNI